MISIALANKMLPSDSLQFGEGTVTHEGQSPFVKFNTASRFFCQQLYQNCMTIIENLAATIVAGIDINISALLIHVHLLRLETVIKIHQTSKFPDVTNSPVLSKAEILRYAKTSEEALRAILRTYLFTDNWAVLPHNSVILSLEAPSPLDNSGAITGTNTAAAQSWVYTTPASASLTSGDSSSTLPVTAHGYLLYAGVSLALRMHVCLARLHIELSGMNDAKIHLRSALDLYTRYLKPVELQYAGDVQYSAVTEVSALVPLIGTLRVSAVDTNSLRSQIGRQQRIVMDVLAEYYYKARSYTDALNGLCGSVSVQPLPMHAVLDRLGGGDADGDTASRANNGACVLLRAGKAGIATLLLRQSMSSTAPSASSDAARYNLAVSLLRQSQPLEALMLLQDLMPAVESRPHVWLRRAECCILHHHLLVNALQGVPESAVGGDAAKVQDAPISAKIVHGGRWQRVQIAFPHAQRVDTTALAGLVERALLTASAAESAGSYFTSCVRQAQQAKGYRDCPPVALTAFLVRTLVHSCSLAQAAEHLSTGLGIINRALKRNATGDNSPESERSILALKSIALLKLAYVQLALDNPHSALIHSQELRQLPSTAMTEHHRHLATFYHVEILCRLGSEHEAAVLLKASAAVTLSAWQTALTSSLDGGVEDSGKLGALLPPGMFFSGARRVQELCASSAQVGALLKQLHRVNDAIVLLLRCELDAARVILEDIVRTDRDLVPAVQNLAYVYIKQGKSAEVLALLAAVKCVPSS